MNLNLDHGCGFRLWCQYLESDGETPINCTAGGMAAQVRPEPGGELLGEFAVEWDEVTEGSFSLLMDVADVDAIPDGVHRWDLVFTDSLGMPIKISEGSCTKKGTITEQA
jgi:hypothetical protein